MDSNRLPMGNYPRPASQRARARPAVPRNCPARRGNADTGRRRFMRSLPGAPDQQLALMQGPANPLPAAGPFCSYPSGSSNPSITTRTRFSPRRSGGSSTASHCSPSEFDNFPRRQQVDAPTVHVEQRIRDRHRSCSGETQAQLRPDDTPVGPSPVDVVFDRVAAGRGPHRPPRPVNASLRGSCGGKSPRLVPSFRW